MIRLECFSVIMSEWRQSRRHFMEAHHALAAKCGVVWESVNILVSATLSSQVKHGNRSWRSTPCMTRLYGGQTMQLAALQCQGRGWQYPQASTHCFPGMAATAMAMAGATRS